jgi:hypothetical protein
MYSRHRRRTDDSDDEIDEEQFLQFRRQDSSQLSRQSSLRSSQKSVNPFDLLQLPDSQQLLESQESHISVKSDKTARSTTSRRSQRIQASLESQDSARGIPREFDYRFRSSQNDEQVLGLDINSPVSLSIGVVCVVERGSSDNNAEIKAHTLQKTFYSYPKNAEEKVKKAIEDRIENDVADFKLQGYHVTTYMFGLPFHVEETCNISRGYDGKTKMLRASRKRNMRQDEAQEAEASSGSKRCGK